MHFQQTSFLQQAIKGKTTSLLDRTVWRAVVNDVYWSVSWMKTFYMQFLSTQIGQI